MPQSPEGHNSLGWVLFAQNEVDAAIAHYRTALKWRPEFVQAHINLANALVQKGDLAAALREAREGARVGPGDSEAHRTVGRVLDFSRDFDGAIREMRRPSNWSRNALSCMTISGRCWFTNPILKALPQNFRGPPAAAQFRASTLAPRRLALSIGRAGGAATHFQAVTELNPESADGHFYWAQVLKSKGDTDAAIREMRACIALQPDYPNAQNSLRPAAATQR